MAGWRRVAAAAAWLGAPLGAALENGLGRVPQMGYNTWYDVLCEPEMNESFVKATADALVASGLVALGYRYVNIDDCWAADRGGPGGRLRAEAARFPSGDLRSLAAHVHARGLLFGTYTDRGDLTCAGRPGARGNEALDAQTFAEWGVDYLKEDSCNASTDHAVAFAQYAAMRDALNATGRPIFFSICGWSDWYAPAGASLANSWRVGPDDINWGGILANIDIMAGLRGYGGPGGWNDPCLLLSSCSARVGECPGGRRVTELQTRAQFSMWAVLAAPLLISGSVVRMSAADFETYSNRDVIAISQDPLGRPGARLVGGPLSGGGARANVWGRPLAGGDAALLFLNAGLASADAACDAACLKAMGFDAGDRLLARDLWAPWRGEFPLDAARGYVAEALAPQGGHVMLRVRRAAPADRAVVV